MRPRLIVQRPSRTPTYLTPHQRELIQQAVNQLRPDLQYSAILRIEEKLATRGRNVTDALVSDVVNRVIANMVRRQ